MKTDRAEVVLFFPFWSQGGAMNFDSNYVIMRRILPIMLKMRKNWVFVVAWPDKNYGAAWKYFDDDFMKLDRIVFTPWRYDSNMRMGVLNFDSQRFKQIDLECFPSIYWLHQVEIASFISRGFKGSFSKRSLPAVVAQHHYIIHESLPYPIEDQFPRRWLQVGGTIAADRVVLNSQHCQRMMLEAFAEFLNSSKIQDIESKSSVLLFGLVDDAFDIDIEQRDLPAVVYNHRFENYKQPRKTAEVLRELKKEFKFEVVATQSTGQPVDDFPVDRFAGAPDYRQYLKNIALPAINTINSVHETFCISMTDSIALGHLPVAPNAVTFPELVPANYPFLFKTQAQQLDIMRHLFRTWPKEYEKWSPILRDFAKKNFAIDSFCRKYIDILERESSLKRDHVAKDSTNAKFERYFEQLQAGTYKPKDVFSRFRKIAKMGDQAIPNRRIFRELDSTERLNLVVKKNEILFNIK